jgi:chromatin structure-remodeling complex subunit SFH1
VDGWGVVENEPCDFHGTGESAVGVGAGWRFDEDGLGHDWEPKIEVLSKEEIEKREGDRERQLRRARRETARFTTSYALQTQSSGLADLFSGGLGSSQQVGGGEDERMGRGERSKKKRRFRSLSPVGRETPEVAGFGGTSGQLTDGERQYWRCSHCQVWGSAIWGVRDGPSGHRVSLHHREYEVQSLLISTTDSLQQLRPPLRARQEAPTLELQPLRRRKEPSHPRSVHTTILPTSSSATS